MARDSPNPEAYYQQTLAKYGKDYRPCFADSAPQAGSCPKPASLGSMDLKQQINVELILDASGSMAEQSGGETKLKIAQRVLTSFIDILPANANVALRVYGHKGSSADADKAMSCASSELLYPFQQLDKPRFQQAIGAFQPSGWTPLAASFDASRDDFSAFDPETSSNFVYVVTDGVETCDGDPVASARQLHTANVQPIINIVGFDIDPQAAQPLRDAAEQGGGKYYPARNAAELNQLFTQTFNWVEWTRYYECRFRAAQNQFSAVYRIQQNSFTCVYRTSEQEYMDIYRETGQRLLAVIDASQAELQRRFKGPPPVHDDERIGLGHQSDALIDHARELHDYARSQGEARHAALLDAADKQRTEAIAQADTQRDAALKDLEQQRRQPAGSP